MYHFSCKALIFAALVGGRPTIAADPTPAAPTGVLLRLSQWKQLEQADLNEPKLRAAKPTPAECHAVRLRIESIRAVDTAIPAGQRELLAVVNDGNELAYVRKEAFTVLAAGRARQIERTDASDPACRRELVGVFCNPETVPLVRQAALKRLAAEHVDSPAVQRRVLEAIRRDTDVHLCVTAIWSLNAVGLSANEATPVLIPMLDDDRVYRPFGWSYLYVSEIAMDALGSYGPAAAEAIPRLRAELHSASSRPETRKAAQKALSAIGRPQDIPRVESARD